MNIEEMIEKNPADCYGCEACKNICPKKCISMERDAEGFAYPKIDKNICVGCGKCDKVCPSLNFQEKIFDTIPAVFFAINPDEKVRRHSSSGGVFSALSKIILDDGGIVFGAGFDENFHVRHMSAENFDDLENLRGSKYLQSQIGETFKQVEKNLREGRKVLFTGTACQCVGLKNFLGSDFENLLTVDLFCHGVPSPMLWENYISWRSGGHEISRVNFRSKRHGWINSHLEITFKDSPYFERPQMQDVFLQEFLLNLILRPSCHSCKFRYPNLASDLTFGDAWAFDKFAPELFDNRGLSLVVTHTQKSVEYLNKTNLFSKPAPFDIIVNGNGGFLVPTVADPRRKNFFDDLAKSNAPIYVMQKYFLKDFSEIAMYLSQKSAQLLQEKLKNFLPK